MFSLFPVRTHTRTQKNFGPQTTQKEAKKSIQKRKLFNPKKKQENLTN